MKHLAAAFGASILVLSVGAAGQTVASSEKSHLSAPISVKGVLEMRRFTLETPYTNTWSKEQAQVRTGTLIVLEVDPALVVPRDTLERVLYAGDVVVQRLNHGNRSGRVVGIVPGDADLEGAPIYFGAPQLPERIDENMARQERERAEKAGLQALPAAQLRDVQGPAVQAKDLASLLRDVAAGLVDQYSPQEKQLADSWRLPEAKAAPGSKSN